METVETTNFHVVFAGNVSRNLTKKHLKLFYTFPGKLNIPF